MLPHGAPHPASGDGVTGTTWSGPGSPGSVPSTSVAASAAVRTNGPLLAIPSGVRISSWIQRSHVVFAACPSARPSSDTPRFE